MDAIKLQKKLKGLLILYILLLVLSGITAFPLEKELAILSQMNLWPVGLESWIDKVYLGLLETNRRYPFLAYGTDWLAFAHLAIAVFFIGPLLDPVRNSWIIKAGLIVSVGIFPLAFIAGSIRGIPFFWQIIDCAFGVISFCWLWYCLGLIKKIEQLQNS